MKREPGYYWVRLKGTGPNDWEIAKFMGGNFYIWVYKYEESSLEIDERRIVRDPEPTIIPGWPQCSYCGKELTLVRPGKHQCDNPDCIQNKVDEDLMKATYAVYRDEIWAFGFEDMPDRPEDIKSSKTKNGYSHYCEWYEFVMSHFLATAVDVRGNQQDIAIQFILALEEVQYAIDIKPDKIYKIDGPNCKIEICDNRKVAIIINR